MTKKIRIAGPPGTGKTTSLVKIYYSHLKQYSPTDIIVISHTNTAADHIRGTIYSDKSIQEYQEDTKHEVFGIVKNAKETLKQNVITIHKFCKDRVEGKSFLIEDYEILANLYDRFNKYTTSKTFQSTELLFKKHPFFKFMSFARDNGMPFLDYYRTLSLKERDDYKYTIEAESERLCKKIKVLIVDEAQDSSVIQRQAEKVMSKNVDYFYKAGDPDQSIFEFAGADPDSFHKEFADPEIELEQGHRCPRVINEYCKQIIKPVWEHYGYERLWRPRETKEGEIVEGEIFEMSNLTQDPFAPELKNRILNTKEQFVFTYRGNEPKIMIDYLVELGMPMKVPSGAKLQFKYPTNEIKNQRSFLELTRGEKVSSAKVKLMLKSTSSQYINNQKSIDDIDRGSYTLDWLVQNNYLVPGVKGVDDFQLICKDNSIIQANYIRKIVNNNRDLEDKRIFLENIHTTKGKEFENVVIDLTITQEEEDFVKRRIKFVGCSRAKQTLWTIKSRTNLTL